MLKKHDVIIIGGGPVGLTFGIALAQSGFDIAIIEKTPLNILENPPEDGRGYALAYGTVMILKTIGVWDKIKEAYPIHSIHVQENQMPFFLTFEHKFIEKEAFGYLVESHTLRKAIWDTVQECTEKIKIYSDEEVLSFNQEELSIAIDLKNGEKLSSPLVVASDGRYSKLRQDLGIKVKTWPYAHHALVTRLWHEKDHEQCAYEYFFENGPFALLPLNPNESSLVWCEKENVVHYLQKITEEEFILYLQERCDNFGQFKLMGNRFSYPLLAIMADKLFKGRIVLLGDAAQAIHPVAGQGLNLGMRGMAALAEALVEARLKGLDYGSFLVLERYERERRFDRSIFFGLTHGLVKLFEKKITPLKLVRSLGLGIVDRIHPLKNVMMQEAMGIGPKKPKLIRGEKLI